MLEAGNNISLQHFVTVEHLIVLVTSEIGLLKQIAQYRTQYRTQCDSNLEFWTPFHYQLQVASRFKLFNNLVPASISIATQTALISHKHRQHTNDIGTPQ